jgi:hypothetical protein
MFFFNQSVIYAVGWKNKLSNILDFEFECPFDTGTDTIECPRTDSIEVLNQENSEILRIVDCGEPDARLDYKLLVSGQ